MLLTQEMAFAFSRALESAGRSMEAKIAMIAMTTSSSIKVKDFFIFTTNQLKPIYNKTKT